MIEVLAQVTAPPPRGFTAGLVLFDDRVVETAPILRRMRGWSRQRVREYCQTKGWKVAVVHQMERAPPPEMASQKKGRHI